jgi:hypothetical protein
MDLEKSVQPDESELRKLMEDADCPDCIPQDIIQMHYLYGAKINYSMLEIKQAFKAGNGDFFVMFKEDNQNFGAYGYGAGFWGRGRFLYPVITYGGTFSLDGIDVKLADPLSELQSAKAIGNLKLKAGKLTIECSGKTANLVAMAPEEKGALLEQIMNEEITIKDFSEVRAPRSLLKAKERNYYFYLDSAYRGTSPPRFFMGEASKLKEYPIEHFYYFRDGGTTIVDVKDQGRLYIPQEMFETDKLPAWTPAGSEKKEELEKLQAKEELLKIAGVDTSVFKMADYPNPCDIFKE